MTLYERQNPDVLNGSRRRRIANGSGVNVQDVNQLIKQFRDMRKMMKQMGIMGGKSKKGKRRNGRGLPGGNFMDLFNGLR
jgi:signal recognition particle subunit SRP54